MKLGMSVQEVAADEIAEVCQKLPHMKGLYENLTPNNYAKMLRNRISALKSRIKMKAEKSELAMLREMARRVFLLKKYDLLTPKEYELLRIDNEDDFQKLLQMLSKASPDSADKAKLVASAIDGRSKRKQDIVPSLD